MRFMAPPSRAPLDLVGNVPQDVDVGTFVRAHPRPLLLHIPDQPTQLERKLAGRSRAGRKERAPCILAAGSCSSIAPGESRFRLTALGDQIGERAMVGVIVVLPVVEYSPVRNSQLTAAISCSAARARFGHELGEDERAITRRRVAMMGREYQLPICWSSSVTFDLGRLDQPIT